MTVAPKRWPIKVWWVPQVPMESFEVEVPTLAEAKRLVDTLAAYDLFQFEHRVKPDYANAGGIAVFDFATCEWNDGGDEDA